MIKRVGHSLASPWHMTFIIVPTYSEELAKVMLILLSTTTYLLPSHLPVQYVCVMYERMCYRVLKFVSHSTY